MANPIQKSDLISDEALRALEEMSRLLREDKENMDALMASFKQYAGSIQTATTANNGNNDALAAALQKVSELEKAYSELQKAMKENTETQKRVNDEKRRYKKLTDDEIQAVENLRSALAGTAQEQINAVKDINIQNKSYNELNATYNALKDSLNKLTVAERQNTDAGKAMTEQARNIRDTMNQLQQATGNYTLNVGNYASAFNGLRFQTQQLLREIPSAINLQQFFIAISNNLPMFADAVTRYNQALPKMKVQLSGVTAEIAKQEAEMAGLNAQTAEYASKQAYVNSLKKQEIELQALTQSGWKAILRSVVSWQTLLIAGLLLLRKLPDWISKITTKTREWAEEVRNLRYEYNELDTKIRDSIRNTNLELDEIMRRLPNLSSGTTEWANAVARVNEMTGSTLTATTATVDEVGKVTQAYKEQIEQLAKNKFVIERIAESVKQSMSLDEAMKNNRSLPALARILGLTEGSDEYKQFQKRFEQYYDEWSAAPGGRQLGGPGVMRYGMSGTALRKNRYQLDEEFRKYLQDTYFKDILTEKEIESLWDKYYKPLVSGNNRGSGSSRDKQFDFSPSDVDDEYWKSEQARIRMMEKGYDMEIDLQRVKHQEMLEQNDVWQGKREEQLMDNLMGELTLLTNGNEKAAEQMFNAIVKNDTEAVQQMSAGAQQLAAKFWADMEEGQRQHDLIMQGLIIDNNEAIKAINQKYDKEQMDAIQEQYKAEMRVVGRRSRTIVQEQQRNADLAYNINVLRQEMEALTTAQYKDNDSKEEAAQRAAALSKEIEKLRKQMDFTKQLSNYGSVWDIFQRNGAFEASNGTMRGIAKNLLGDLADSLDDEQIEQVYDTWLKNTQKAATEWYNTTMGYINDLIGAYVELANAKAEAAAEATEAAQEEYEKEKALLEAGYASRVEATWAEYQEKKAAQEKAEADAKAAAQAQKNLNEISTAGNMIVAASNIWKTFSAMGPLGTAAAAVAITAMFGAFVQSKIKAAEVSKYGEGGFEVLEGGSHASGHDIDLGVHNRRGRRMRAEGREGLGIFSRRAMEHYGANNIEAMVNSVNRLEFEGNAAKRMSLERNVGLQMLSMPRTDLHKVESGIDKIVALGSRNIHHNPDGTVVETRKNARITYHVMR